MRRLGAHCLAVAMKRGNARGAKGVGHQRWIGSTGVGSTGSGRNRIINGRRQPSHGGTSRMMREYHVRICEGLGRNSPGLLGIGVGRVKTPTLAVVCRRELEIRNFVPLTYFEVVATAQVAEDQF